MKTKTLAVVEIAIVLCSVFLVALPAIAADQTTKKTSVSAITTVSEDDFTLEIYGNANEDDTIDMRDTTYIKLAIFGKKTKMELADANYDGKVSMLDVGQTKLIILDKEKELTFVDVDDETVTVHKPIERIVCIHFCAEFIRLVGAKDKVVGVCSDTAKKPKFYPDLSTKPTVGKRSDLDVEVILELEPDAVFLGSRAWHTPTLEDKLKGTGIDVVRISEMKSAMANTMAYGYILDEVENAREYLEWHNEYMDILNERVSGLSEDEKPKVFLSAGHGGTPPTGYLNTFIGGAPDRLIELAGGKNIASDLTGDEYWIRIDVEWIIEQKPEVIVAECFGKKGYETDDISVLKGCYDRLIGMPALQHTKAVEDNRVYSTGVIWWIYHPVMPCYMAKWVHPDLFEDLDQQAVHQEYIDRFHGIDFDVKEHGVFVYHPEQHPDGS